MKFRYAKAYLKGNKGIQEVFYVEKCPVCSSGFAIHLTEPLKKEIQDFISEVRYKPEIELTLPIFKKTFGKNMKIKVVNKPNGKRRVKVTRFMKIIYFNLPNKQIDLIEEYCKKYLFK